MAIPLTHYTASLIPSASNPSSQCSLPDQQPVLGSLTLGGYDSSCFVSTSIKVVQMLFDADSDVTRAGDTCGTALYVACGCGGEEMMETLLAYGADPNIQQCGTRYLALQGVREVGNKGPFRLLLESRAQTDLYGGYFHNALQRVCVSRNDSITRMLLSHGADVNLRGWNFGSPLITACAEGRLGIAKMLVEAGADLHVAKLVGHSALLTTILSQASQVEVFGYLIGLGVNPL